MAANNPTARHEFFLIRAKPAKFADDARYGLIATKKTFRLAVERNLAKRKLRDWIRFNEKYLLPDRDYVFVARRGILGAERKNGRTAMGRALRYIDRQNAE